MIISHNPYIPIKASYIFLFLSFIVISLSVMLMFPPGLYMGSLFLLAALVTYSRFCVEHLFYATWTLVFINYLLGPLSYQLVGDITLSVVYLFMWFFAFLLGFKISKALFYVTSKKDIPTPRRMKQIKLFGVFGAFLLVIGGVITAAPYISTLDFAGLRSNLFENVSAFSRIGWPLAGAAFFTITHFVHSKNFDDPILTKITFLMLSIVPIFSAGRQLYLQIMLLIILGFLYKKNFMGYEYRSIYPVLGRKRARFLKQVSVVILGLGTVVSVLRFDFASIERFSTKLNMFKEYSGVSLRDGYELIFNFTPVVIQDLFVEFSYYFGAQIPKYFEWFSLNFNQFQYIWFDLINKSPFIARNVDKILTLMEFDFQFTGGSHFVAQYGYVHAFTWSTAISSNINFFGIIGTLVVQFIFGMVVALSFVGFRNNPNSFSAFNFLVANSVLVFYGVIASVLMETQFLVYYLLSAFYFFSASSFMHRQ